jgi:hypothetical protein
MDDFDYDKLARALEGALPPAAALSFVECVRRLTPECRRNIGRIIRGKARWDDWLGGDYSLNPVDLRMQIVTEHPPCETLALPSAADKPIGYVKELRGPIVVVEVGDPTIDPLARYRSGELSIPDNERGRAIQRALDEEAINDRFSGRSSL